MNGKDLSCYFVSDRGLDPRPAGSPGGVGGSGADENSAGKRLASDIRQHVDSANLMTGLPLLAGGRSGCGRVPEHTRINLCGHIKIALHQHCFWPSGTFPYAMESELSFHPVKA